MTSDLIRSPTLSSRPAYLHCSPLMMNQIPRPTSKACKDFGAYMRLVAEPAWKSLRDDMARGPLRLHQVFGANLFVAHAVDYIAAIRKADGTTESRGALVRTFDKVCGIAGARISNRKFELVDALNNALKHIELDSKRYSDLEQRYGQVTFRSLVEEEGRVLCIVDGFRFDYVRVVLRPAFDALCSVEDDSADQILSFARGEFGSSVSPATDELMLSNDPADAIDQMIVACNPECDDCGEAEDGCRCELYVYDGAQGRFEACFDANFDFDTVMSRISGAYRVERD